MRSRMASVSSGVFPGGARRRPVRGDNRRPSCLRAAYRLGSVHLAEFEFEVAGLGDAVGVGQRFGEVLEGACISSGLFMKNWSVGNLKRSSSASFLPVLMQQSTSWASTSACSR